MSIWSILGTMLILVGVILLLPLIVLPFYPSEWNDAMCVLVAAVLALGVGVALRLVFRKKKVSALTTGQDAVIVLLMWCFAAFFSSLPFVFSGRLSFVQAYFESMSGWTSTGMTLMDINTASHVFILLHSVTQFFGGIGLILFVVSFFSQIYGMRLFNAEGHTDRVHPHIKKSARTILLIYFGYFCAGFVAYVMFGMDYFGALNYSLTAVSTGGAPINPSGISFYDSIPLEIVTIVLMILGATGFHANMLLINRKFKDFMKLSENRFLLSVLSISTLITAISLIDVYGSFGKSFRSALFNLTSVLTTTGFSTTDYTGWTHFGIFVIIILMHIGGSVGSTAGGMKLWRICLLLKAIFWNLQSRFVSPRIVNQPFINGPQGKIYVSSKQCDQAAEFFFMYITVVVIGTGILTACGYSYQDSLFEFVSAMGSVGFTSGIITMNSSNTALLTLTAGMLLGRLEIIIVMVSLLKLAKHIGALITKTTSK